MFKKIFTPSKAGKATVLIATASFLSYGIGLLRDRIIAVNFGASSATDTYNASFLIPDLLFNLFIAGALTAAFLPVFSEQLQKGKEEAYKIANIMLTAATITISLLALIAFIFMPQIIGLSFSEFTPAMQNDISNMTRLMLFSAIIFAISNTLGNILMSYKHFIAYAISPILYNLGIILGVIFLEEKFGIYSAAIGVIIGAALHCSVRVIDSIYTGYRYKPSLNLTHPAFKKIIKLMIPKSFSLIGWQANLYIFAVVGVKIQEGGLAAFHFARNIQSFAVSLFGISFATAIFPFLANAASSNNKEKFTEHIQKTMQRILFFTLPAAIGVMALSSQIVALILGGGIFDQKAIDLTSIILFFFALSIPFESLTHILARAFYAHKNTITPMFINLSAMSIMALITIFVAPKLGIEWFSIGFTLGFVFYITVAIIILNKKLSHFSIPQFLSSLGKTVISCGIMMISILVSSPIQELINSNIATLLQIAIGSGSFFLTAYLLKSPEIESVHYITNRLLKRTK
jgi:putative peptidoglycan lipid II flippase